MKRFNYLATRPTLDYWGRRAACEGVDAVFETFHFASLSQESRCRFKQGSVCGSFKNPWGQDAETEIGAQLQERRQVSPTLLLLYYSQA